MKRIIRIIRIISISVIFAYAILFNMLFSYAQELNASYFSTLPQASKFNPALTSNSRLYFNIPIISKFSLQLNTSGYAWKDLINQDPICRDSLRVDFDGFLDKLKDNNHFATDFSTEIFGFGFGLGKNYFTFDISLNFAGKLYFSKSVIDFIVNGTDMSKQNVDLFDGNFVDAMAYLTTAIGYSGQINDNLKVGAKFKIYNGIANIKTERTKLNLNFDGEEISAYSDVLINTSIAFGSFTKSNSLIDDDDFDFTDADDGDISSNVMKNKGFGFDIGAVYQLNENMQISASIVDIGKITWESNPQSIRSKNPNQRIVFSGVRTTYETIVDDLDGYFSDMADSLQNALDLEIVDRNSYSASMPTKIYVGYSWQFQKNLYLDALYGGRIYGGEYQQSLMVNCGLKYKILNLSVGNMFHSMGSVFNPGIFLSLSNVFYVGANFSKSFNLAKTHGLGVYFGMNISIGKINKKSKKIDTTPQEEYINEDN